MNETGVKIGGFSEKIKMSPIRVIFITLLIDAVGYGLVIPLIPFYASYFGADSTALGILVASFALMQFFFSPVLGRVSDKLGRRPVLIFSLVISCVGFILFTLANSYFVLLLSRIIAGMATEYGVSLAYISDITTEGQRTNAVGKVGAASSIGMIIGPALGGLLNIYGNFWSPGLAAVGLTALNLIFIYFLLPETVKKNSNDSVENPLKESTGILRRALSYIRNPMTGMVLGITFIMAFAFSSLPVVLPLISSQLFGFGETEVGIFFAYIGIIGFIIQVEIIAKVSKRMSDEMIIILGLLLTIIGVILIPILPYLPVFLIGISIAAFGIFFADIAIPSFLSKKTPSSEYGSILGVTESFSSIARVPGPLIAGFAYQLAIFSPFYISTIMLIIALGLGIKTNNYNKNYKINH